MVILFSTARSGHKHRVLLAYLRPKHKRCSNDAFWQPCPAYKVHLLHLIVASWLVEAICWPWYSEGSLQGGLGVMEWCGVKQEGSDAALCHSSSLSVQLTEQYRCFTITFFFDFIEVCKIAVILFHLVSILHIYMSLNTVAAWCSDFPKQSMKKHWLIYRGLGLYAILMSGYSFTITLHDCFCSWIWKCIKDYPLLDMHIHQSCHINVLNSKYSNEHTQHLSVWN